VTDNLSPLDRYEMAFRQVLARTPGEELRRLRRAAFERFCALGFPTTRLEEWRFTSVAPIVETPFAPASDGLRVAPEAVERFRLEAPEPIELVFVNGRFAPHLSRLADLPVGVEVRGLGEQIVEGDGRLEAHLARYAPWETRTFVALNTACFEDGAFVWVARGLVLERPIHLLFLAHPADVPLVAYPRVLVVTGESSQITLVETYAGLADGVVFTDAVTELVVGDNSVVDHYRVVREALQAYHIGAVQATLARNATLASHVVTLGGGLVRNDPTIVLDGEGGECTLNGLYLVNGRRLVDNHTTIDHAKPHSTSHELFKGILDGHGRAVFNGKIIVRPAAQKTDAKQTNKALLLSEDAQINTKPELEIFADDVRCTHGATVGQLDEQALFYLRTRGLSEARARSVLIHAFASDVLGPIRVAAIRRQLDQLMLAQLPLTFEDDEVCHGEPD
jgi:Fe-S cluster assembly protein SufD